MPPVILGIAGGTASGKTQLARQIAAGLSVPVTIVSQDWYYRDRSMLSPGERRTLNFDHPSAFDYHLLRSHLFALRRHHAVQAPRYEYCSHRRTQDGEWLLPADVIIVEGLLILHDPDLRALFDLSVFVDTPADLRLLRRLRRDAATRGIDLEENLRLYEHCVRAMHERFVQPSSGHATAVWSTELDPGFPAGLLWEIDDALHRRRAVSSLTRIAVLNS